MEGVLFLLSGTCIDLKKGNLSREAKLPALTI